MLRTIKKELIGFDNFLHQSSFYECSAVIELIESDIISTQGEWAEFLKLFSRMVLWVWVQISESIGTRDTRRFWKGKFLLLCSQNCNVAPGDRLFRISWQSGLKPQIFGFTTGLTATERHSCSAWYVYEWRRKDCHCFFGRQRGIDRFCVDSFNENRYQYRWNSWKLCLNN